MGGKKDPGKFTIRFNIADPQQRTAAELLNQQGRCKAQFITNAVLFYIRSVPEAPFLPDETVKPHDVSLLGKLEVGQDSPLAGNKTLDDGELETIHRTIKAFRSK